MIAVYGANGFIGRHVISRLAKKNIPTKAISRRLAMSFVSKIEGPITFIEADLRDRLQMVSSLQGVDVVVQLISSSSPGHANDYLMADIDDNIKPHVEFLTSCIREGVRRFIFLSSGGTVYGPTASPPCCETHPTNPICSHGVTKLMVEKYIQMLGHTDELEYIILRLANPFGPGQEYRQGQGLIPAILERWHRGLPIRIFGDGAALRDYFFIDDAIDAIELAISADGKRQELINIGSGEARSVIDVVESIEKVVGERFKREFVPKRVTDVDVAWLDISKAADIIGWSPKTEFNQGIRITVESLIRRLSETA